MVGPMHLNFGGQGTIKTISSFVIARPFTRENVNAEKLPCASVQHVIWRQISSDRIRFPFHYTAHPVDIGNERIHLLHQMRGLRMQTRKTMEKAPPGAAMQKLLVGSG